MKNASRPRAGRLPPPGLRLPSRTSLYVVLGFLLGLSLTLSGYVVDYYALYGTLPERWSLGLLQGLHDVTPVHYFTDLFGLLFALAGAGLGRLHDRVRLYSENLETIVEQRTSALRLSEGRYALAAAGANDALWDWDLVTGEMYYSPRWHRLVCAKDGELSKSPGEWFDRVHPEDLPELRERLRSHLDGGTPRFFAEYRLRVQAGSFRWMRARGLAERDVAGRALRIAGSQRDIHAARAAEDQLRFRTLHDVETKLPNRSLFLERVRHAMERGRARHRKSAVLYLGLERIEQVHQTLGQEVGDLLIQQVAERLDACRKAFPGSINLAAGEAAGLGDTLARIRNDEFAILLYEVRSARDAIRLATRILEQMERPLEARGRDFRLGLSVGIALGPGEYAHHEHVFRDAHVAMNRARESGGSRFEVFDEEMKLSACERLALEMELHRALDRDDLAMWYQPIFDLRSGEVDGFEALIRWHHAERGWITPGVFIPLAEESDLIIRIGRFALDGAFHALHDWTQRFPAHPNVSVNVNVSARYLAHPSLLEDISALLRRFTLDASRVHLEITESAFIDRPKEAAEILHELKRWGFQIALDDFGTGYSSLSILHELPIDILKIDGRFVGRLGEAADGGQVVAIIVGLARTLGQRVVAEGIETGVQLHELQNLRCGFGQGFFLGRPAPQPEVEAEYLAGARQQLMAHGG